MKLKRRFLKRSEILFVIFVVALLLRIIIAFQSSTTLTGDEVAYDAYARSIVKGEGFAYQGKLTSFRPPLYSFFLSSIYLLFGRGALVAKIVQAILGMFICIIIYFLGKTVVSEAIGWISLLISVFYPPFIWVSSRVLTETLFIFLFLISIFYLIRRTPPSLKDCCLGGLFLGLATLTKGTTQLLPICVLLYLLRCARYEKIKIADTLRLFIFFLIFFLLPILPWTVRNYLVHRTFVPVTTETGEALYSSYFPREGKLYGFSPEDETIEQWRKIESEAEGSKFLTKKTWEFIRDNPRQVLFRLLPLKIAYFFSPFDWEIIGGGVYNFIYVFFIPFSLGGIIISLRRKKYPSLHLLYLVIVYCFLLALIFYGSPRYRLIIEPYLIIFAALGIYYFFRKFSHKVIPILITVFYFSINLTIFFYSRLIKEGAKAIFQHLGLW